MRHANSIRVALLAGASLFAAIAVAAPALAKPDSSVVVVTETRPVIVTTTPYGTAPYTYTTDESVVVVAPEVRRTRDGEVAVTRTTTTKGLDLRYGSDVNELDRRVNVAAWEACEIAEDLLDGRSTTSDRQCVRRAVRDARPQVREAVADARY